MTSLKKTTLAGLFALAALSAAGSSANATPTTFAWTSAFADNGSASSNNIAFTGTFANGGAYSMPLSAGDSYSNSSYLTINETDGSSGTGTENISVTFTFTAPGSVSTTIGGTESVTLAGKSDKLTGAITWLASANPDTVTFADGAQFMITLENVSKWNDDSYNYNCSGNCATVGATFTVLKDPIAVPEPVSVALLGTGLFGLGIVARRRRQSTPTVG